MDIDEEQLLLRSVHIDGVEYLEVREYNAIFYHCTGGLSAIRASLFDTEYMPVLREHGITSVSTRVSCKEEDYIAETLLSKLQESEDFVIELDRTFYGRNWNYNQSDKIFEVSLDFNFEEESISFTFNQLESAKYIDGYWNIVTDSEVYELRMFNLKQVKDL